MLKKLKAFGGNKREKKEIIINIETLETRVAVLEDGKLVQRGSHDELVEQDGLYKRIWGIQNSLEDELEEELETVS